MELVREGEQWKVFLDWAVSFTIRFRAEVREQLPIEFSVQPESIALKLGETGSAMFRVRNVSDATVKANVGHLFDPPVAFLHTELVQCFCFEDTYEPGVERELPVALSLGWDSPPPRPGRDHHAVRVLPAGAVPGPAARRGARRVAATRRQG